MHRAIEDGELRKRALDDSLGSVRLEGLDPSVELRSDLESWAGGHLEMRQVGKRMLDRFAQQDLKTLAVAEETR